MAALCVVVALSGCNSGAHAQRQLSSSYPLDRARAAVLLAERGDMSAVHTLVNLLEDDDRTVRMYAIGALRRLCNDDMGYRYYASTAERSAATRRWREALRDGEIGLKTPGAAESARGADEEPVLAGPGGGAAAPAETSTP